MTANKWGRGYTVIRRAQRLALPSNGSEPWVLSPENAIHNAAAYARLWRLPCSASKFRIHCGDLGSRPYRRIDPPGFPGSDLGAKNQIHLRKVNEFGVESLPGIDDAMDPTFSPDGEWLAFLTSSTPMTQPLPSNLRQLKKIRVAGGAAETLAAEISPGRTGIGWGDDGHIVFTSIDSLLRVSAGGGTPGILARVDEKQNEFLFLDPQVLPGGAARSALCRHEPRFVGNSGGCA